MQIKVSFYEFTKSIVSSSVQISDQLSQLTLIHAELRNIRKAINDSVRDATEDEEIHYFVKLKEIIDDILSIKDYDPKSYDLLKFINKDIIFLYETCEGTANTMLYIERIADLADSLMTEIEKVGVTNSVARETSYSGPGMTPLVKLQNRETVNSRVSNFNTSSRSERQTLINTKRNELLSIKRQTMQIMNELLQKSMNLQQKGIETEDFEEHKSMLDFIRNSLHADSPPKHRNKGNNTMIEPYKSARERRNSQFSSNRSCYEK